MEDLEAFCTWADAEAMWLDELSEGVSSENLFKVKEENTEASKAGLPAAGVTGLRAVWAPGVPSRGVAIEGLLWDPPTISAE